MSSRIALLFFLFISICCLCDPGLHAQVDSSYFTKRKVHLKTLSLLNVNTPSLKVVYEIPLRSRRSVAIEAGIISDFGAEIYRLLRYERGVSGTTLGALYLYHYPMRRESSFLTIGGRLNLGFVQKKIEDWERNTNYSRLIQYKQSDRNVGGYLHFAYSSVWYNKLVTTLAFNPGVRVQFVKTNNPYDTARKNDFSASEIFWFNYQKKNGIYLSPHLFIELKVGMVIEKSH